jgi:hypothetical protein
VTSVHDPRIVLVAPVRVIHRYSDRGGDLCSDGANGGAVHCNRRACREYGLMIHPGIYGNGMFFRTDEPLLGLAVQYRRCTNPTSDSGRRKSICVRIRCRGSATRASAPSVKRRMLENGRGSGYAESLGKESEACQSEFRQRCVRRTGVSVQILK